MEYPLHPMLVHFPIALFTTSVLFEVIGIWWNREGLRDGALWLLGLGLIGGVAAAIAGGMAEEAAEKAGIAESLIENHETMALITLGIFGVLFLWKAFLRNRLANHAVAAYFFIAVIGLGTLAVTGHLGGDLVYEHGAGVSRIAGAATPIAKIPQGH